MSHSANDSRHLSNLPSIEQLEERLLLTTLVGGDVFEYVWLSVDGVAVHKSRIALGGDIIVEVIGATVDGTRDGDGNIVAGTEVVLLSDVPGNIIFSTLGRTGPVGGGFGGVSNNLSVIGYTSITDPIYTDAVNIPRGATTADNTDITIRALASMDAFGGGATYGFNIADDVPSATLDVDDNPVLISDVVQLVNIDHATGAATVVCDLFLESEAALGAGNGFLPTTILGADFAPRVGLPTDGLLYFVADIDHDNDGGTPNQENLYTIDPTLATATDIYNSLTNMGTLTHSGITTIAFEQVGMGVSLLGYAGGDLIQIDPLTAVSTIDSSFGVTTITGIEFVGDDPASVERYVYAIEDNDDSSQLLRLDRFTGGVQVISLLPDPFSQATVKPGMALEGLAWNPVASNPFTGGMGVLLATDIETDQLVAIDAGGDLINEESIKPIFTESDVFAFYVVQAGDDASISIGYVPMPPADQIMLPYENFNGDFDVFMAFGSDDTANIPAEIGQVYIGARTNPGVPEQIPYIFGDLSSIGELGTRAAGEDDFSPSPFSNNVWAGIRVIESLTEYVSDEAAMSDRLMRYNLDRIAEMAVRRDGFVVVVDVDQVDENGLSAGGDQIASVDPDTGQADLPLRIIDSITGGALMGIQGLDYGDIDFDGIEELYAIYNLSSYVPSSSVGNDLGADFNFTGLTVAADGKTYVVNSVGGDTELYWIDRDATGAIVSPLTSALATLGLSSVDALEADPLNPNILYVIGRDGVGNTALFRIDLTLNVPAVGPTTPVSAAIASLGDINDGGATTDPVVALALSRGGTMYAVMDIGGVHTLLDVALSGAVNANLGAIWIDGDNNGSADYAASIVEMDFDSSGQLIAIDRGAGSGTGRIVRIDTTTPGLSGTVTLPGSVAAELNTFTSDHGGAFFFSIFDDNASSNELYISAGIGPVLGLIDLAIGLDRHIPSQSIGGTLGSDVGGNPVNFNNVQGIATVAVPAEPDLIYVVDANAAGGYDLYQINRLASGAIDTAAPFTLFGEISDQLGNPILDVLDIKARPSDGTLHIIGRDRDGDQALFTLAIATSELDGTPGGEVLATPIAKLNDDDIDPDTFTAVTDQFTALAFTRNSAVLYAVRDVGGPGGVPVLDVGAGGGVHTLYAVDTVTGDISEIVGVSLGTGEIQVDENADGTPDTAAVIAGMDFDADGNLMAREIGALAGTGRLITIDLTDPGLCIAQSTTGSISGAVAGYASDDTGVFFSAFVDTAWESTPPQALFSRIDVVGAGVIDSIEAMAFTPGEGSIIGQMGLYVVDAAGLIYEIDPTDASIVAGGDLLVNPEGFPAQIVAMDFDETGTLYAHDRYYGNLVDIDLSGIGTGLVWTGLNTATTINSLRPTIGDIGYDYANDRFLAADNSISYNRVANEADPDPTQNTTWIIDPLDPNNIIFFGSGTAESAALMELHGIESDSAVPQHMDKLFIGGILTGHADFAGSIRTFYAGWLITGQASGQSIGSPNIPDNFYVGGDIHNLLVKGPIGFNEFDELPFEPIYVTGFDLEVQGKLGQMVTWGTFVGTGEFRNLDDAASFNATDDTNADVFIEEYERFVLVPEDEDEGILFEMFELFNNTEFIFYNNTFETAQYVGSLRNPVFGEPDQIRIKGNVNLDLVDYYAVGLRSGQTVTIQLFDQTNIYYNVMVYDPQGRLVASAISNVDPDAMSNQPFQFTPETPGDYRIAGVGSGILGWEYNLLIEGAGDMAAGGIVAWGDGTNAIFIMDPDCGFFFERGDLGALWAGGNVYTYPFYLDPVNVIKTANGNVNSVVALGELGIQYVFNFPIGIEIAGHAGLFRSGGPLTLIDGSVQGNLQMIDSMGDLGVWLDIGGGLGTIRAAAMTATSFNIAASYINVDADNAGRDGIIDLIFVIGDFGTSQFGGPQLTTGLGGDIRFIRVFGDVYQDVMFGQGWSADKEVTSEVLVDDSGGAIRITATPSEFQVGTKIAIDNPTFDYTYYGVRSGGGVIMDISSQGGVSITADSNGNGAPVQISRLQVQADATGTVGRAVIKLADGTYELAPDPQGVATVIDVNVVIRGETPVDVFEIVGGDSILNGNIIETIPTMNLTSVINMTGGDIIGLTANSIGSLISSGNLGLAYSALINEDKDGTLRMDMQTFVDYQSVYPYLLQGTAINTVGHIAVVRAGGAVGNFIIGEVNPDGSVASLGGIGSLTANAGNPVITWDDTFNGIAAPIQATDDINRVQIGEGIAPSGTGLVSQAGLYSLGRIERIINQGLGSDIWGDINASGGIGHISLQDGSIINANIHTATTMDASSELITGGTYTANIDKITLRGLGGIIGSLFYSRGIGNVSVDGFGILNSVFSSWNILGSIADVTAAGFGVQDVIFTAGGTMGDLTATGSGAVASTLDYSETVQYSLNEQYHPIFGQRISALNDIHAFLGTSTTWHTEVEGLLSNIQARGIVGLGVVDGYRIVDSNFDFASSIEGIKSDSTVDGLEITTGRLGYLRPGGDVTSLDLNVAGLINQIIINGSLLNSSTISALGPNGNIKTIRISGDMEGDIHSVGMIGSITIGGDLTGQIIVDGTNATKNALSSLRLGGSLLNGSLDVNGNVGTIEVAGDLGVAGDTLTVNGNLGTLKVGTDRVVDGSNMLLDLAVEGNLGTLDITGRMGGNVFVGGNVNRMYIKADAATQGTDIVTGDVTILGDLKSGIISDGNLDSSIVVGDQIGTFSVNNGDIADDGEVASSFGDIKSVNIKNGDLLGSIRASNGAIGMVRITGSDMTAGSSITAEELKTLRISGSILAGASVDVIQNLSMLQVDMDMNGSVTAGSMANARIGRDLLGDLTAGLSSRGTTVTVGRDLGGDVSIDGDARLTISRNVTATGTADIGRDLTSLRVTGTVLGDILAGGYGGSYSLGATSGAVITTGFDLKSLTVSGNMVNTLVQVGASQGDDGTFGTGDLNETGRMAALSSLSVRGSMIDSIVAAGGDINKATLTGGMTNSSVSSGLYLGGNAIAAVMADADPLNGAAEQNAARSGADKTLFRGNFGNG